MCKRIFAIILFLGYFFSAFAQKSYQLILPEPATQPNAAQKAQINRQYGMFIHFGINTFHDTEWSDGSLPASTYSPLKIDADQWIRTAKEAGMKYVILVTKHHDGFCLWNSSFTSYDVASSPNPTDVVEAVAKACEKHDIGLGLYYSLWDRKANADVDSLCSDAAYNSYMLNQINELIDIVSPHTPVVEFWFDGGWVKPSYRWPLTDIYQTIKSAQPTCQVGINWSIGLPDNPDSHLVLPQQQRNGYPIRYFPSDFRLGDPYLPSQHDSKLFVHDGKTYYMPWESTVCISNRWFYNTSDHDYKTIEDLVKLYNVATANNNILIINCPPARDGRLRPYDIDLLKQLRKHIGINP